jgi:hypothetical protein
MPLRCMTIRDYERLALIESTHDLAPVVAQLALADLAAHSTERRIGATLRVLTNVPLQDRMEDVMDV